MKPIALISIASLATSAVVYIVTSIIISRKNRTLADHIPMSSEEESGAAVRSPVEFSTATVATTISLATVILAYAELASWAGTWLLWTILTTAVGIYVVRMAAPAIWRRLQDSGTYRPTLHGFLGAAYDSQLLVRAAALCTSLGFLGALAVELTVGSRFLASLTPEIPMGVAVILIASIGVIYTALGGFRAVIVTDRMQMTAIWISIGALILLVARAMFTQSNEALLPAPRALYDFSWREGLPSFLIGVAIINIPTYLADMSIWQRIAASRTQATVERGLVRSVISAASSWTALALIACLLVLVVKPVEGQNPLLTFLITAGLRADAFTGLLLFLSVAGLYAASLSTASTQLIAAGHAIQIDLLRPAQVRLQDQSSVRQLKAARWILLISAAFSVAIVEGLRALGFSIADLVFAIFGAQLGLVPAVLVALFGSKNLVKEVGGTAAASVLLGFVAGWGSAIWGKLVDNADLVFLAPAVSLVVSLVILSAGIGREKLKTRSAQAR